MMKYWQLRNFPIMAENQVNALATARANILMRWRSSCFVSACFITAESSPLFGSYFDNLRPGAYLSLETQVYDHAEDSNICYFMHMHNNDRTNFWALSPSVQWLELVGFAKFDSYLRSFPRRDLRNTCRGSAWSRENRNDLRLGLASILSEH